MNIWSGKTCSYFVRFRRFSTINKHDILGKQNKVQCIEKLQSFQPIKVTEEDLKQRQKAAVLVPLCHISGEPSILYTLRNSRLKRDGGHVSFPGGLQDEKDASLEETALRETHEELGIKKDIVDIWGHGSFLMTREQKVIVLPYVGYVGELDVKRLTVNDTEVAQVFSVPLKTLCDPKYFAHTQFRSRYVLPVYLCAEHRIWGLTALITHIVMSSLLPHIYKNKLKFIKPVKAQFS